MQQPRSMAHYCTFIIALKFNSHLIKTYNKTARYRPYYTKTYITIYQKICPHCLVFLLHTPEIQVTFSMR